jgi:hypothetical protein
MPGVIPPLLDTSASERQEVTGEWGKWITWNFTKYY